MNARICLFPIRIAPWAAAAAFLLAPQPATATPTNISATYLVRQGGDGVSTVVTNGGSSTVTTIDFYPNDGVAVTGGRYQIDDSGASGGCGFNSTLASCVVSLPTGHKATITVTTSPPLPDRAGARVSVGDGAPPAVDINVGGPAPPPAACPANSMFSRPCADLAITNVIVMGWRASGSEQCIHPPTLTQCDIGLARPQEFFGPGERVAVAATVVNNGPDPANRCFVRLLIDNEGTFSGIALLCSADAPLAPMQAATAPKLFGSTASTSGADPLEVSVDLNRSAARPDWVPDPIDTNNVSLGSVPVLDTAAPRTAHAASDGAAGTVTTSANGRARAAATRTPAATQVKRVDVAFLRAPRGAKLAAAKCMWVKNARSRFKGVAPTNRVCDRPIWLHARGTSNWSYKLRSKLPKGRYLLYVRAVDAGGVWDDVYSTAKGNKRIFTVR